MNLEGLVMLYAVSKHSQKKRAAKALNTSLDTLNKYLQSLENELGVKLVSASERGCSVTSSGEKILEIATQVKDCLSQIYSVSPLTDEVSGEIRIIYDRNVRCNIYLRKMGEFYSQYPNLSLLTDVSDDEIIDMSTQEYDIALSYDIPKGEDVVIEASKYTPCGFFVSADYLLHHPCPQSIDEMLNEHHLVLKKDAWKWLENAAKIKQSTKRGTILSNSTFVVNDAVMNGAGIGVMPMSFAKAGQKLVCLDHLPCHVNSTIYLTSHQSIRNITKVRMVLDYYKRLLADL